MQSMTPPISSQICVEDTVFSAKSVPARNTNRMLKSSTNGGQIVGGVAPAGMTTVMTPQTNMQNLMGNVMSLFSTMMQQPQIETPVSRKRSLPIFTEAPGVHVVAPSAEGMLAIKDAAASGEDAHAESGEGGSGVGDDIDDMLENVGKPKAPKTPKTLPSPATDPPAPKTAMKTAMKAPRTPTPKAAMKAPPASKNSMKSFSVSTPPPFGTNAPCTSMGVRSTATHRPTESCQRLANQNMIASLCLAILKRTLGKR